MEDHRKWGGSGTLDNDDGEHDNNWLGYGPARLYDKDDPVDKEETRATRPSTRGHNRRYRLCLFGTGRGGRMLGVRSAEPVNTATLLIHSNSW